MTGQLHAVWLTPRMTRAMEHPLIAVLAPLAEINPARHALHPNYRAMAQARLGRLAGRIFAYQMIPAILATAAILLAFLVLGSTPAAAAN